MNNKKSIFKIQIKQLKKAVFLKCLDCCNCQYQEIIHCPIINCPLWEFRPLSKKNLLVLGKKFSEKKLKNFEAKNY